MKTAATLFRGLCISLNCYSQEQKPEGRFIKFDLQGGNTFDIQSSYQNDNLIFTNAESHSISSELGYGWFYTNKKSMYFGAGSAVLYQYTRSSKQWSNSFFFTVQKTAYKNMYDNKIFFTFGQSLRYTYAYSRAYTSDPDYHVKNPYSKANVLNFYLKPGLMYRYNHTSVFMLQIDLVNLQLSQRDTRSLLDTQKSTSFRYTLLSNYNLAAIQIGYLWMPSFIQSKKSK